MSADPSDARNGVSPRLLWLVAYLLGAIATLWAGTHDGVKSVFLGIAVLMLTFFADQFSRMSMHAFRRFWWVLVVAFIILGAGGLIDVASITSSELFGALFVLIGVIFALGIMLRGPFKERNKGQYSRVNQSLGRGTDRSLALLFVVLAALTLVLALVGF